MEIIKYSEKQAPTEILQCPVCECTFSIQNGDLYDISCNSKGHIGFVNCPKCKIKLKVEEHKCLNKLFKLWFSLEELSPKYIL